MKARSREFYRLQSGICRTIAHARRLEILDALRDGELSVGELAARVQATAANVSQQLSILREAGVLAARREGTSIHYRIVTPKVLRAYDLMTEAMGEIAALRSAATPVPRQGPTGAGVPTTVHSTEPPKAPIGKEEP